MKEQVMFIDDDKVLLDGLRRLLRPMREEWDMTFCSGGREALELMNVRCFDVVVSDMRMPELDGAEVLSAIREKCPNTVRIILSGQAEIETIFRSLSTVHQYIGKPCSPDQLKYLLNKAFALRRLMRCKELCSFVSNLEKIPSDPVINAAFITEASKTNPSVPELARLASNDVGLTLKILQLSNSGFFGTRTAIFDPAKAISILGAELIKKLVTETDIFLPHKLSDALQHEIRVINHHSQSVANLARDVAVIECEESSFVDACFASGLLHDLGKIVLCAYAPEKYSETFRQSCISQIALEDEERRLFGASHSEIGSYLLSLWGIPDPVVQAVAYHHQPALEESQSHTFGVTSIIHATNALQECMQSSELKIALETALPRYLDLNYLQEVRRSEKVTDWLALFRAAIPCYEGGLSRALTRD